MAETILNDANYEHASYDTIVAQAFINTNISPFNPSQNLSTPHSSKGDLMSTEQDNSSTYGDSLAGVYDMMYPDSPDAQMAGQLIAELAGKDGTALELGVGTGRIASHVANLGVEVVGVDSSQKMLDTLHSKYPDAKNITTHKLDFTIESTEKKFDVVYIPLSTFFVAQLPTSQLNVMRLMRDQLKPNGVAVVEAFDPATYHSLREPKTETIPLSDGRLQINTTYVDHIRQIILVDHITIGPDSQYETAREIIRYAFPTEMDLMAQISGLEITARWGDWQKSPFTVASHRHISVYKLAH